MTANKPAKNDPHFHSFCFVYFLVPFVVVVALSSLLVLPRITIVIMGRFCLKARRFDEKRADEIDVRRYPFSGSVMRILPFLVNFVLKFKLGVSTLVKNAPVE